MIFKLNILLISISTISAASSFDEINKLNPQIPSSSNPSRNGNYGGSEFFTSPPTKLDPFQASDGGEIKPNYDASNWNRSDPLFNNVNPLPVGRTEDWFPSISSSPIKRESSNNSTTMRTDEIPDYRQFMNRVSVINANNFYNSAAPYRRDLKLLSLAYSLMSTTSRSLNILHLGTGSGYVPLALAIFGQYNDMVVSLDDRDTSASSATENITKDGKRYYLSKIQFRTVEAIPPSLPISRPSNEKSFDLVVFSKSVPRDYTFPAPLINVMNPRGYLIYPEDGRRLKIDRLDGNGALGFGIPADMDKDDLLKKVAALDNFDLPILCPEYRAYMFKHPGSKRPANFSSLLNKPPRRKNHRSDDGLEGTRHLSVEQRHDLLEPLGYFNFENFERNYPTACEADYRLSLAQAELFESDNESDSEREKDSDGDGDEQPSDISESTGSEYESIDCSTHSSDTESPDLSVDEREFEGEFEWNVLKRMEYDFNEESPEFLDSLANCTHEELRIRAGTTFEHSTNGRLEHRVDTFLHRPVFNRIFEENLRRVGEDDRFVREKMAEMKPIITTKSFTEMYVALVQFLYELMVEMDHLYVSMCSIYYRSRSQCAVADITTDLKRIREVKVEQPGVTLNDILSIFFRVQEEKTPECVSRYSVPEEVVREAMRRLGADKYGPRDDFASIINAIIPETEIENDKNREEELNTVKNTDNIRPSPPSISTLPQLDLSNLSAEQIENLQSVLKTLIHNKLKK